MSYSYRFHPLALNDYADAYEWYENQKKGLGERFIKAVRQKINEIALRPEAYGKRKHKSFREAKVAFFPFMIFFRVRRILKK